MYVLMINSQTDVYITLYMFTSLYAEIMLQECNIAFTINHVTADPFECFSSLL